MSAARLPATAPPFSFPGILQWAPWLTLALGVVGALLAVTLGPTDTTAHIVLTGGIAIASLANFAAAKFRDWQPPSKPGMLKGARRALESVGFVGGAAVLVSLIIDGFALAQREGFVALGDIAGALTPIVGAFASALLVLASVALLLSVRVPGPAAERRHLMATQATILLAVVGLILARLIALGFVQSLDPTGAPHTALDAVFALNFAAGMALAGALLARRVPTPFRSPFHEGSTKAVLYPALAGIIVVFVALILLAGSGVQQQGSVDRVLPPLLLMVVAFLVVGTMVAVLSGRRDEPKPLFVQRMAPERKRRLVMVGTGVGAGAVVFLLALATWNGDVSFLDPERGLELALLAPLAAMTPVAIYDHLYERRRIALEDRIPDFLRDLAASRRAGLTLPKAVVVASGGSYDALNPEVRKMAEQVSWGTSFEEALDRMADRVNTLGVRAISAVVREASSSGGEVHDVLQVVSEQRREARELDAERRRQMSLYVTIIYVSFFVFVAILLMLGATFLPAASGVPNSQTGQNTNLPVPAAELGLIQIDLLDYRRLFMVAGFVQGVGDGVVAGVMSTSRFGSGLKHAVIMGACGVLAFSLFMPIPGAAI
ncbi:MAG TPA: type II secretion system F family protein [Candidatus Thermoplasmatota archaeon]|nr:type II secretion system F family protein [Candidatus Thermoplasmatota archaeon]